MPYHYKQFKPGSPEYRKAYAEHMVKKLKKKRKVPGSRTHARSGDIDVGGQNWGDGGGKIGH